MVWPRPDVRAARRAVLRFELLSKGNGAATLRREDVVCSGGMLREAQTVRVMVEALACRSREC